MRYKSRILISLAAALVLWIAAAPFLARMLIVQKPLEKADVILVLGGSSVYVERTHEAARLFKQGVAPKILLTDDGEKSGWSQIKETNPPFVELAREELIANGIPENAIEILTPEVAGTMMEASVVLNKAKADKLDKILIVTSAYHTRRALWIFEKTFAENTRIAVGITAPADGQQTPSPITWWLSPHGWRMVAGEYVKSLYYWMFY